MRIDNTPTDNWLCGIVIIIAVMFSHHPYASDKKVSALAEMFHQSRVECWQRSAMSNHVLIECENDALRHIIAKQLTVNQKLILNSFLQQRLRIADHLDQKQINSDEYRAKLFDEAADFQKKIIGKEI